VPKYIPKKGLYIVDSKKNSPYKGGVPVFLIDRKEQALENQLKKFRTRYHQLTEDNPEKPVFEVPALPERSRKRNLPIEYRVRREQDWGKGQAGIWLSRNSVKNVKYKRVSQVWWWLPPIVWPDGESHFESILQQVLEKGGKRFVLNSFWQMACFEGVKDVELWAGPFCNFANPFSIFVAAKKGFSGAFVSPELTMEDYLHLPRHSPLPLGIVLSGFWPLCISRIKPETIDPESPFTSPKGETAWFEKFEDNIWIYPNWKLSFSEEKEAFQKAGYSMFVHLQEQIPTRVELKKRPGRWNLDLKLD
jgi:putative protease